MNVLSLFDGISCGRIALERAGVGVDIYYASEIDPCATAVAKKNYPDTIHLGDVTKWREWGIDWSKIDLIFAGSPCQSFSAAGDGAGFADERGKLFFVMLDILNHCKTVNPDVKWLVENVRMKREFLDVFDAHLGVESLFINSAHFSALNRPRHYWTNIPQNPLPAASEAVLADVLEQARDGMPWLSEAAVARLERINERAKKKGLGYKDCILTGKDKYLNLDASYYKGCDGKRGVILQDGKLRMLTPLEAERLQTLPEGYTSKGLDIRYQLCYTDVNECNTEEKECQKSVELKDVINRSQIGKLNFAINTILDSLDLEQQNLLENLLISLKTVTQMGVTGSNRHLKGSVSSVIKRGNELNQVTLPKHVQFVLNLSDKGRLECVLNTINSSNEMETLYTLKSESVCLTGIAENNTIKTQMVNGLIEELLVNHLEDPLKTEKLFIILTLINLIMSQAILSCSQTQNTSLYIDSLNRLQGSLLEMDLLSLKTESTVDVSNSARYNAIGNGWTVDVITHLLKNIA